LAFARSWVTEAGDSAVHYDSRINGVSQSQMPRGYAPANSRRTAVRKLWAAMVVAETPAPHLDLESRLADERAFFSQNELLRFMARGYAHSPKSFANAMAGLPVIGARQSFRLCPRKVPPSWPHFRFEIVRFVEKAWNNRVMDPHASLEAHFRSAVLQLPVKVAIEKSTIEKYNLATKTKENYFRRFFCENWRYLRLAIKQVVRHQNCVHSSAVPYLITNRLFINYGKARTAEDSLLAEIEALKEGASEVESVCRSWEYRKSAHT